MTDITYRAFRRSVFSPRRSRRGIMLLIVTLVLAALTLSGAALLTLMKTERDATSTRGRDELVQGVDRSAVVFMISALESTPEEREQIGGLYDNPRYFCATPVLTLEEGGDDASRFTIVSPKFLDSKIEGIRYGLVDESSRLNLDAVLAWDRESPGAGRRALMKLPGMTEIAADSILDWVDPDENARPNGAEAAYYSNKKLPFSPRNAVPVFLEELLLARGVTRAQLYGSDEDFTYNIDDVETDEERALGGSLASDPLLGASSSAKAPDVPWKELITVFSAEKDVDPQGEARVDLNGANLEFLYQELESRVGAELAKFIVLYRQYGSQAPEPSASSATGRRSQTSRTQRQRRQSGYTFANTTNANGAADADPAQTRGTLSNVELDYSVEAQTQFNSPLDLVGARVVVGDVYYDSPITSEKSNENNELLFKTLDFCSTNASTTIVGRVNVNVAPRPVLSALPGLTATDVQKILDSRPDPSKRLASDYRHAAWLYTKGVVDLATMRSLYNKTTSRGDVYRGQVVGFLDGSEETARAEVVVDGTTIPPRQVFYKDLTTLGKGFSNAVLLGGMTSTNQAVAGTELDGNSSDLFEIEFDQAERVSAYATSSSFGTNAPAPDDPFAAIDLETNSARGSGYFGGGYALGGLNANAPQEEPQDPLGVDATILPDASGRDSQYQGRGFDASDEAIAAQSFGGQEESSSDRRARMLDSLRQARDQRQARFQEMRESNSEAARARRGNL